MNKQTEEMMENVRLGNTSSTREKRGIWRKLNRIVNRLSGNVTRKKDKQCSKPQ